MKSINWKSFGLAVGGAFVAGFGSTFGAAVDGMSLLSVPLLKAAVAKSASAGLALAWPVALGFFIPGYKSVSYKSAGTTHQKPAEVSGTTHQKPAEVSGTTHQKPAESG